MGDFEAIDLIEAMDQAVNYNRHLLGQALSFAGGARSVLDFGAGNGRLAVGLVEHGFDVFCVEPDQTLRAELARRGLSAAGTLEELESDRFEYVVSFNVLEHIEDDLGTLREMRRVLRPGGRCLIYVPAFMMLYSSNDRAVGHVRRYKKAELTRRFQEAGFEVEMARYCDSLGFAAALLYRFGGDPSGRFSLRGLRAYDRYVFPISQRLDGVLGRFLGKNALVGGVRPIAPGGC